MKQISSYPAILSILLSALPLIFSCTGNTQSAAPLTRELITVTNGPIEIEQAYTANVEGRQDVKIYPQVTGKIEKVCITEGQSVSKGQTLFIIDQVPYRAALRVADANVRFAEAELGTARLEMESKQALFEENVVSEYDLSMAKNALAKAEAQLEQAKAAQVNAANDLSYTTVKSPVNGVSGTLPYREGALVGPSIPTPLTVVSDNNEMFVYFSIGESELRRMKEKYGNADEFIKQMPPVKFRFSDGTPYSQNGVIESVSGVLNPSTGTVSVRSIFPNEDKMLLSGSIGNVVIPFTLDNATIIPQEATFEIQGKFFVQKVIDHKANTTEVTIQSAGDGRHYVVLSGLEEGDVIIGSGAGLVRNGDQIN